MHGPHLGYIVQPNIVSAAGTSSVHGNAADITIQHIWHCPLQQPEPSHVGPQQQHGKHGAPVLQHTSQFIQQTPTLPLHNAKLGYVEQLIQHNAQHNVNFSSSTASSLPIM